MAKAKRSTKRAATGPTTNKRSAESGSGRDIWIGADDVEHKVRIDLSDLGGKVIGIEVDKHGPDFDNRFGYWPMFRSDVESGGYTTDDVHASLPELCDDYGIPLAIVIDRMAIAFLRLAQAEAPR